MSDPLMSKKERANRQKLIDEAKRLGMPRLATMLRESMRRVIQSRAMRRRLGLTPLPRSHR